MQDHAGILQQRIEIAAVGGNREKALERIRGKEREGEETDAHEPHHAQHPRDHLVGQMAAEHRDRRHPEPEHEHPEQERALVAAPHAGNAVMQRQRGIGMVRHVRDREVIDDERVGKAAERDRNEHEQSLRNRPRRRHPYRVAASGADNPDRGLRKRKAEGERKRKLAELGDHRPLPGTMSDFCAASRPSPCACFNASAASGGM